MKIRKAHLVLVAGIGMALVLMPNLASAQFLGHNYPGRHRTDVGHAGAARLEPGGDVHPLRRRNPARPQRGFGRARPRGTRLDRRQCLCDRPDLRHRTQDPGRHLWLHDRPGLHRQQVPGPHHLYQRKGRHRSDRHLHPADHARLEHETGRLHRRARHLRPDRQLRSRRRRQPRNGHVELRNLRRDHALPRRRQELELRDHRLLRDPHQEGGHRHQGRRHPHPRGRPRQVLHGGGPHRRRRLLRAVEGHRRRSRQRSPAGLRRVRQAPGLRRRPGGDDPDRDQEER